MSLLRVGRNVSDLVRLTAFYRDALGFAPDARSSGTAQRLRLGQQDIELTHTDATSRPGGTGADPWFQHIAVVTTDIEAAVAQALRHGAAPISRGGVQHLPPEAGRVAAFKFRDPDGHPLELIQFPPGSPWDTDAVSLTLGYDHSALSVVDTERSIAFYTELLGFRVTARQVNHGPAQDRLDGMEDVHVDVVTLTPSGQGTPHVELLGYRGAAPVAALWDASDIVADRLVLQVYDLERTAAALAAGGYPPFARDDGRLLVRDPSGHVLVCAAKV